MNRNAVALWSAAGLCGALALVPIVLSPPARAEQGADQTAGPGLRGVWTAQLSKWKTNRSGTSTFVQLEMQRGGDRHRWNSSFPVPLEELKGLSAATLEAGRAETRFELARDAGTFAFDGRFEGGEGAGHFSFAPSREYVEAMRRLGYGSLDDERVFSLAVHDVSRGFIRELAGLGYEKLPLEDLLKMRIHGASPDFIRELKALGYEKLPVEDLVKMRIHGASPDFVRELKALGYEKLPVEDLVKMRIHGVTPEFVKRVQRAGGQVSPERLVEMRIHGREP